MFLLIIHIEGMTYLYKIKKQQNIVIKVSGRWIHINGTHCQKKLNLQPQYLYLKILSKLILDLKFKCKLRCT